MIVFPSTNSNEPKEKIITEYNICNIVNRLVDKKAFVISANTQHGLAITFNIDGYIFSTNNLWGETEAEGFDQKAAVYASIGLYTATGDGNSPYWDTYKTLNLTQTEPTVGTYLELWDGNGVPRDSWVKFNNSSTYIDDGDLDPATE